MSTKDYSRNLGDGRFEVATPAVVGVPTNVSFQGRGFPGDFDGDGDDDLVAKGIVAGKFDAMRLLLNNGGGGLRDVGLAAAPGVEMSPLGSEAQRALAADATGDGVDDLFTHTWLTNQSVASDLWINDGTGFFQAGLSMPGEMILHVGDLDADGLPDLLSMQDTLYVRYGTGGGAFAARASLFAAPPPTNPMYPQYQTLGVADLDADGDDDVVVTMNKTDGDSARILENLGNRVFVVRDDVLADYAGSWNVFTGDVNADGLTDLLLGWTHKAAFTYSVYLQTADPALTFESIGDLRLDVYALADVDGDGDDDAVWNGVMLNRTFSGVDGDGDDDAVWNGVMLNRTFSGRNAGLRVQYGASTSGSQGQAPTLGARGPFRVGEKPELIITGAAPDTVGVIVHGDTQSDLADLPVKGAHLYASPWNVALAFRIPGNPAEFGSGRATIPYTVPASAAHRNVFVQVFVADAGAVGGAAVSNGLRLRHGP